VNNLSRVTGGEEVNQAELSRLIADGIDQIKLSKPHYKRAPLLE